MESRDLNQIRSILNRLPRSNVRMYELLDMQDEEWIRCYVNNSAVLAVAWAVMFWAEKEEDILPLFKYIPRDQREVELFCVENRFISILDAYVAPVVVSADCHIWTLDELSEEAPVLGSLTLDDAPFVNDLWDYKSEQSIEFIRHCIASMPTSCIRNEKEQPIAMAFCYGQSPFHINMGGLKVLPEYRRQGLGKKIHLDICRKILAQNRKPLAHIRVDNRVSQHLCQSTGFRRNERVFWGKLDFQK